MFVADILPLLAQADPEIPGAGQFFWWLWFFVSGMSLWFVFTLWMAISCVKKDPEWTVWLWIILIFQPFGAIIYFLARWLPSANVKAPEFAQKFLRRGEIQKLEIAAHQIGNAHQFIELGDALRGTSQLDRARDAYLEALKKDADNTQALWGAGWVHFQQEDFQSAHEKLSKLVAIDPTYKFGDVSLLHGKTLSALDRRPEAIEHLEGHIKRWRHPEALYVLAQLHFTEYEFDDARNHLQSLIMDIDASPTAIARKQMRWKSRAQKLLRRLP